MPFIIKDNKMELNAGNGEEDRKKIWKSSWRYREEVE